MNQYKHPIVGDDEAAGDDVVEGDNTLEAYTAPAAVVVGVGVEQPNKHRTKARLCSYSTRRGW